MTDYPHWSVKHGDVYLKNRKTTVRLEQVFWDCLRDIAAAQNVSVRQLTTELAAAAHVNLSSAIRVYVLNYYRLGNS
jgi:predicted DNA-binding ribbon-helix-helix protein